MGLRPAVGPGTRSLRGRRGLPGCPFASGPYDSLSILVGCPDPLWSVLHRLGVVRYGWDSRSDPVRTRWGARGALLACRAALIRTNRTQHSSPSSSLSPSRVSASPPAHVQARAVRGGGGGGGGAARHVRRRHGRPIDN